MTSKAIAAAGVVVTILLPVGSVPILRGCRSTMVVRWLYRTAEVIRPWDH